MFNGHMTCHTSSPSRGNPSQAYIRPISYYIGTIYYSSLYNIERHFCDFSVVFLFFSLLCFVFSRSKRKSFWRDPSRSLLEQIGFGQPIRELCKSRILKSHVVKMYVLIFK